MAEDNSAEVVEALENNVSTASAVDPAINRGADAHVVIREGDEGQFFKTVREEGLETDTFRSGDVIRGWVSQPE